MTGSQKFVVFGTPRPQGSGAVMVSKSTGRGFKKSSPTSVAWRNIVVDAILSQHERATLSVGVPVAVEVEFRFGRPRSHSKLRRHTDGRLKADGADLDKLCRLVLDALVVARVLDDDRQVCDLIARKRYVISESDPEGMVIFVDVVVAAAER